MNTREHDQSGEATQSLDESPYRYGVFTRENAPRLDDMVELIQTTWSRDYRDRAIIRFDSEYLEWLMSADCFLGVRVEDRNGTLVGLVVGVRRNLVWRDRLCSAMYSTLLTVRPGHQRRGVPQNIIARFDQAAADVCKVDVGLSAFDQGSAGRPVVRKTIARQSGKMMTFAQPLRVWGCAYDLIRLNQFEPLRGLSRLGLLPGIRTLAEMRCGDRDLLPPSMFAKELVEAPIVHDGRLRTRLDEDWLCHYPHPPAELAGTVRFKFSEHERCTSSYHVLTLSRTGLPDGRIGQIQLFDPETASPSNLLRALRHLHLLFQRAGCIGAVLLDVSAIPTSILLRSRFLPTDRHITFSFRGPKHLVQPFVDATLPFRVDLL